MCVFLPQQKLLSLTCSLSFLFLRITDRQLALIQTYILLFLFSTTEVDSLKTQIQQEINAVSCQEGLYLIE